jgi:Nickel responsive protein SCO4226-like
MSRIIVERTFESPLTEDELRAVEARMAPCLDLYRVRWIRSYWSTDRQRMICEYDAGDLASVRNVQREADAKFDRLWAAELLGEQ